MKNGTLKYPAFRIVLENIRLLFCAPHGHIDKYTNHNGVLRASFYDNFTTFPQKMWKTCKSPFGSTIYALLLCILVLASCNVFKATNKEPKLSHPALQNGVISMTEDEVRKKVGEPDVVSKTADNKILWTYKPSWKLIPDNKDTVYLEFENGRVTKIIKAR
jgi:hypothetical protein